MDICQGRRVSGEKINLRVLTQCIQHAVEVNRLLSLQMLIIRTLVRKLRLIKNKQVNMEPKQMTHMQLRTHSFTVAHSHDRNRSSRWNDVLCLNPGTVCRASKFWTDWICTGSVVCFLAQMHSFWHKLHSKQQLRNILEYSLKGTRSDGCQGPDMAAIGWNMA